MPRLIEVKTQPQVYCINTEKWVTRVIKGIGSYRNAGQNKNLKGKIKFKYIQSGKGQVLACKETT